jgi:2'-5' RNA ligase
MSDKNIAQVRSFIAIDFPSDLLQRLAQVMTLLDQNIRLRQDHPNLKYTYVRWVKIENMHLTLKFLGDVESKRIKSLGEVLKGCVEKMASFDLIVRGLGAFPRPAHPNVIWAGIEDSSSLMLLQKNLDDKLATCGFPPEERPFRAHLTLGRVARNLLPRDERAVAGALIQILGLGEPILFGGAHIDMVHLYRSDLEREGAYYTRLFSVALQ